MIKERFKVSDKRNIGRKMITDSSSQRFPMLDSQHKVCLSVNLITNKSF